MLGCVCGLALCGELIAVTDHLDELPAPQLKVDVLVVAKYRGVVRLRVLERSVDVTFEDGCAYFWQGSAHVGQKGH